MTPTTAGPVTGGTTVASGAFVLVRNQRGGQVRPAPAGPLPLALRRSGDDDEEVNLVLVFPLLRARPRCVRQVELWLRLLRFGQQFRYQDPDLATYPSQLVSLATDHPASRVGWETLIDNRPSGAGSVTGDGNWMHFDIAELYRIWAEGGPFRRWTRPSREGRRWSSTSGRRTSASRCSRPGSPRSVATGRPRRSCGGRRPGTAEPRGTAGKVRRGRGDDRGGRLTRCSSCRG